MFKRPQYVLLVGVALVALVVIGLPRGVAARVKGVVSSVFLPLVGLSGSVARAGEKVGVGVLPRRALEAQLEAAKRENERLKLEAMQWEGVRRENELLRGAVGWQQSQKWALKLARVTVRDPANWWRSVHIDAGERDGVRANMAVVSAEGLVGRVEEAGESSARVVLLGDPNCRVAAVVVESKDRGVIAPGSATVLDEGLVELTYLSRHSQARAGNRVVTSGAGGIFPGGIEIGRVAEVESVGQGLYMEARVKLSVDLARLEVVWVILGGVK